MSKEAAQFVFMTCRAGAEAVLKQEIARTRPGWRLAFSRPGFVTLKHDGDAPIDPRQLSEQSWTFAYTHGVSLGRLSGTQLSELVEQFWSRVSEAGVWNGNASLDLHVWQRDVTTGDAGEETFVSPLCQEIEALLRAAAPESAKLGRATQTPRHASPRNGVVLDVVVVEPAEWWIGYHHAIRRAQRWPGGAIPVRLPAQAVSRAYAKMEEAIQWSDMPLAAEDECVEIGCAPGGATQALLDRGLFVTGIDPADVDEAVLAHPRFRHLKKRGSKVRRQEFAGVRWLAADMNIAPDDAISEVQAIVTNPQVSIRGLILTLKLSDWSIAQRLPEFVDRVRGWGYRDVRVRQLVTGGQEVCLVALRRKALRRLGRKAKPGAGEKHRRTDEAHPAPTEPHF